MRLNREFWNTLSTFLDTASDAELAKAKAVLLPAAVGACRPRDPQPGESRLPADHRRGPHPSRHRAAPGTGLSAAGTGLSDPVCCSGWCSPRGSTDPCNRPA